MKLISKEDINSIREGDLYPLKMIFEANNDYCIQNLKKLFACDEADAKDVTIDAIMVLQEKIRNHEYVNKNVRSYLLTVASNIWRNKARRDSKTDFIDPTEQWLFPARPIDDDDQEYIKMKAKEVIAFIHTLNDPCRSILDMVLLQGFTLDSALEKLDYESKGVLKSTKSRCLDKIRNAIDFR